MGKAGNIFHLGIKELQSFWHDKVLFIFVVWAFTGGIYAAATATSMELHNAPLAVVDEDRSQLSQRILSAFYKPYFLAPAVIDAASMDPAQLKRQFGDKLCFWGTMDEQHTLPHATAAGVRAEVIERGLKRSADTGNTPVRDIPLRL